MTEEETKNGTRNDKGTGTTDATTERENYRREDRRESAREYRRESDTNTVVAQPEQQKTENNNRMTVVIQPGNTEKGELSNTRKVYATIVERKVTIVANARSRPVISSGR